MLPSELKAIIKENKLCGLFVFCGEEDYLKRYYLRKIKEKIVTNEVFAAFNYQRFDGEEIDFGALSDAVSAPPFMADRKLIEWYYPNFNSVQEKDVQTMEELRSEIEEGGYATLIFVTSADGLDIGNPPKRPSKAYERLSKGCKIVNFDFSDDVRLSDWITAHFASEGVGISKGLAREIIDRVGHSMEVLSLEIDKLICYVKSKEGRTVTSDDISEITSATFESDAFGLTNAILDSDADRAFADIKDKRLRKTDSVMVLGAVSKLFGDLIIISSFLEEGLTQTEIAKKMKMHEYKAGLYIKAARKMGTKQLERALEICKNTDISSKTGGKDSYSGLERLISEVIAVRRG